MNQDDFKNLEKKVDRILFYLESDGKTNQSGLIEDVAEMKKDLADLIIREKILYAKASVLGAIGGALFFLFAWIFDHFIIQKK